MPAFAEVFPCKAGGAMAKPSDYCVATRRICRMPGHATCIDLPVAPD